MGGLQWRTNWHRWLLVVCWENAWSLWRHSYHTHNAVTGHTDIRVGTSGSYAPLRHSMCAKPWGTANSQRLGQFSRCVSESAFIKTSWQKILIGATLTLWDKMLEFRHGAHRTDYRADGFNRSTRWSWLLTTVVLRIYFEVKTVSTAEECSAYQDFSALKSAPLI